MVPNYDVKKLKKSIDAYRKGYLRDIEMFGEDYWKEKILNTYGSYEKSEVFWEDYHTEEIADGLDNHCPNILILAKIILEEY